MDPVPDDDYRLAPLVTRLAIDVLGEEAALTESNLHERFPDVFPRFWYSGSSPLIIIEGDATPTWTPYMYIEMPTNEYIDGVDGTDEEDSDNFEPSSKRIKTASSSSLRSRKTIRVGMPTLYYTVAGLADLLPRLEDSTHRPIAIIGFIISVLGGTLHLTYPPTLTDAQLYCEVIALSEQLSYKLAGLEATFSSTLNSFRRPQPIAIDPPNDLLIQLAASTWVSCNQNETCLSMIALCLSTKTDQTRLLERLGSMVTLNPGAFVQMVRDAPHGQDRDYNPPSSEPDSYENRWGKREDREPRPEPCVPALDQIQSKLGSCLQQYYTTGPLKLGNDVFEWIAPFNPDERIPLDFISIVPTGDEKAPNQTETRFLAHVSLLVEQWPYFARLMNSGLSEAQTRVVRLPLSTGLVKALLYCLYCVDYPLRYLTKSTAMELIERAPEFGFGATTENDPEGFQISEITPFTERMRQGTLANQRWNN